MIQQQPRDVLEIEFEGKFYYLVVITKIVYFGGNIVFAFHGDGEKAVNFEANPKKEGFNICTDLLMPKKAGIVSRLGKVDNIDDFIESNLVKSAHTLPKGQTVKRWWLKPLSDLSNSGAQVKKLTKEQEMAMDSGCYSFELVAQKILTGYKPNQNPLINRKSVFRDLFS